MDTITITWDIRKGVPPTDVAAVGKVRWHLPSVMADGVRIYGNVTPTPWVDLVAGAGGITIPDPRDTSVVPVGWVAAVEVETDAWSTTGPHAVSVPAEGAGPFTLQGLALVPWAGA